MSPARKYGWNLLLGVAVALAFFMTQSGTAKPPVEIQPELLSSVPVAKMKTVGALIKGNAFQLELAMTPEQQRRGLMFREHLEADRGMVFPFMPPRAVTFWMKNTRVTLDMLFVRNNRIVNIARNVPPCQSDPCPTYGSTAIIDRVIELPGGTADAKALSEGDTVTFTPAPAQDEVVTVPAVAE